MGERYLRQQQVPQFGVKSQQTLAQARVLIVGAGGLGSPVAHFLAGAGVGSITLMDFDQVALSNLHRQTLFSEINVGQPKARAAAQRLRAINSEIKINAIEQALAPSNAEELVTNHTVIVDTADSFFTSYLLSDICFKHRIPLVSASVIQTNGYVGVFCGRKEQPAPSLRSIFPAPPTSAQNCVSTGVTGPSVGIVGSVQAQEVLKVILRDPQPLLGTLLYLDLWHHRQNRISFKDAVEPKVAASLIAECDISDDDLVLDVRSELEISQAPRDKPHKAIPVDQLSQRFHELDEFRRVVCVCKSGQRALNAAYQLIEFGFKNAAAAL